jgi:hypothetical protein
LELADEILVGVLCHSATLISVKENVVHVQRGSHKGLVIGDGGRDRATNRVLASSTAVGVGVAVKGGDSPQALVNGADIKIDLYLVVLKGNEGEGKTGVGAEPELEGHVERGLGECVTGGAHLTRSSRITRRLDVRERGVGDEGKLGGVTNHLEITALLLRGHGELVPDVHPVTVLAIDALAANLDLNLGDELLTREIEPTGIDTVVLAGSVVSEAHKLVNLGESHLKIGAVGKITVAGDHALNTATEIGLAVESLFNRLDREVGISAICHFPESNLRIACKVDILSAISYELH